MRVGGTRLGTYSTGRGLGNQLWDLAGSVPSLDLRFAENKSLVDATTGSNLITFTRAAGPATYFNSSGVLVNAATNEPRFDHNPTTGESLGLLVEEQRTNSIRNNTMVGAVAGTPGTPPTNWTIGGNSGLTYSVIGTGTDNGIQYIDIRFNGTTAAVAAPESTVTLESSTAVAAVQNQTWTGSAYVKIVGGSLSGIISGELFVIENNISGAVTGASSSPYSYSQLTGVLPSCRVSHTRTLAGATTAFVVNRVDINFSAGGGSVVDCTLRIGLPQLELGAFATSVIPTTGTAATRNADVASITGTNFSSWYQQDEGTVFARIAPANPVSHAHIGFDDGSSERWRIGYLGTGTNSSNMVIVDGGVVQMNTQTSPASSWPLNTLASVAAAYKLDDIAMSLGGLTATTDTSATIPTPNKMTIGNADSAPQMTGTIRRLTYWPQRLSNTTLQQITT